ncbi:hypothetical protein TSOC_012503 [Tetrabaena socialis]|uniref:BTB domain-containing protein n=1 Tax=Tetrabaena socialis TaxID=47790 RepID=A0A2J7ZMU9_9CHLO|nr:hypothetical protein TSOC_012503 [Tetrabaena socialis]|eukprot:PNH01595.1 hypothetical protein TSOC_012503 [Tetrabaena socialis]
MNTMTPVDLFSDRNRVPGSDVTLSFGDGQLYAHRLILSQFPLLKTYFELAGATATSISVDFVAARDVTREAVAGLLAFAYTEAILPGVLEARNVTTTSGPDLMPAMAYLGTSATFEKKVRNHGRCKCCDEKKPLAIDEICEDCFKACGDREIATLPAMWLLGFKPVADAEVDELCAEIRKDTTKTCSVFYALVQMYLGIDAGLFDSKQRLSDVQARTVQAALDPDWCSLVHIGLRNLCAIPGNYEFGNHPYYPRVQTARRAQRTSSARMPLCSDPGNVDRTCARRVERKAAQAARDEFQPSS